MATRGLEPLRAFSRHDAQLLGRSRYFTGKPCKRGHTAERLTKTCHCIACETDRPRRPYKAGSQRPWYKTDAGRAARRDDARRRAARDGGYVAAPRERDCPPRPANGKCQCCGKEAASHRGKPPGVASLCMDHDHKTGIFRGWTCNSCNRALGFFDDSMVGLRRAVLYMAAHYLTGRSHGK